MDSTEEFNLISNTILLNPTNELKLSQICNDNKVLIVAFGTGYQLKISAWDYPQRSARTWVCTKGKSQYITSNFESMLSSITHQFMLVMYAYCVQSKIKFPEFIEELDIHFTNILKSIVRSPTFRWPLKF
ncbi:unnamed protein product [Hymenolepis diminuta]|uniref:Uncharacterized protein n=1 Tax=Hymenolepis diminuta TaxID=6216 RepID=A0A564Z584_HYMDI|nr:unnamed protein product [Hymenolepis diminuta]